jgi:hypothetical protein
MAKTLKTTKELIDAAPHIDYEIRMMTESASELQARTPEPTVVYNALLESFLVHARGLIAFLFPERWANRMDDIAATDYYRDWPNDRTKESPAFEDLYERIGKEIAHLTYRRATSPTSGWRFLEIATEIQEVFDAFLLLVPDSSLDPLLVARKQQATNASQGQSPSATKVLVTYSADGVTQSLHKSDSASLTATTQPPHKPASSERLI